MAEELVANVVQKKTGAWGINQEQLKKAISALFKFHADQTNKSQTLSLLPEEEDFLFVVTMSKVRPQRKVLVPKRVGPLPHPIHTESDICLICGDEQHEVKWYLQENNVTGIKKVHNVQKLKKKLSPYEARRKFLASYDLIVTDRRVVGMLPSILGKKCYANNKHPIAVHITKPFMIPTQIAKVRASTFFTISSGADCTIKIGKIGQTEEEVFENLMFVAGKIIPKYFKWQFIQHLSIRITSSPSLPFHTALPWNILPSALLGGEALKNQYAIKQRALTRELAMKQKGREARKAKREAILAKHAEAKERRKQKALATTDAPLQITEEGVEQSEETSTPNQKKEENHEAGNGHTQKQTKRKQPAPKTNTPKNKKQKK